MSVGSGASRRDFLKVAGAATVLARSAGSVLAAEGTKPVAPSDRIRIATLGMGSIGVIDTETALKVPGVELVAVGRHLRRPTHAREGGLRRRTSSPPATTARSSTARTSTR